jgi:hypothetical protein
MAIDEAFQFHERLNIPVGTLLGDGSLGIFYFPWVIPGIALVSVLGLYFLRFLLHLPAATGLSFLMAATLYIGGAIGVELIGSSHAELHGYENLTYSMIATLEESLEMAGLIVFIWALLNYCADNYKKGDSGLVPNKSLPGFASTASAVLLTTNEGVHELHDHRHPYLTTKDILPGPITNRARRPLADIPPDAYSEQYSAGVAERPSPHNTPNNSAAVVKSLRQYQALVDSYLTNLYRLSTSQR